MCCVSLPFPIDPWIVWVNQSPLEHTGWGPVKSMPLFLNCLFHCENLTSLERECDSWIVPHTLGIVWTTPIGDGITFLWQPQQLLIWKSNVNMRNVCTLWNKLNTLSSFALFSLSSSVVIPFLLLLPRIYISATLFRFPSPFCMLPWHLLISFFPWPSLLVSGSLRTNDGSCFHSHFM